MKKKNKKNRVLRFWKRFNYHAILNNRYDKIIFILGILLLIDLIGLLVVWE